MSGQTTVQTLSATTTGAAVALLPATSNDTVMQVITLATIAVGAIVFISITASRIYRAISR
jgi:hypothetical protein